MRAYWIFEDVNLFKLLCPHKYKAHRKKHDSCNFEKHDFIYMQHDHSRQIYLIEKGKVKIGYYDAQGNEITKAILGKGEIFGERALLATDHREEFAQSIDSCSICAMGTETMHELMRNNRDFTLRIYKFLNFRFKKLERRLKVLLHKDTKTRLKEFISDLCEEGYDCPDTGDRVIQHSYTQQDMASLIGTSRPTLSTLMNELQQEGYLRFSRKQIRVLAA